MNGMRPPIETGRIVKAKAGRDKGGYFAVVKVVDDRYVYIADGVSRRLANPKLKKTMHLEAMPQKLDGIAEKLDKGLKVYDAELKSAILKSGENSKEE